MIPFRLTLQPGSSIYEQVVYAAKKAMIAGQLRSGDPFPSVRALSRELRINPNTAHKVITHLLSEGMLEVLPGIGTVVATRAASTAAERSQLLRTELEQLVVKARTLGLDLDDVTHALSNHWERLGMNNRRKP